MAHVEEALQALAQAHGSNDPICISAEHARIIHNLITSDPAVLAANIADAAIDAAFAARDVFWNHFEDEEAYWYNHRRLVRAIRAVVDVEWLIVKPTESVNIDAE